VNVSLSLEMIKILFSFNFYNSGYSVYSGNTNFEWGFVVLYVVTCTQFGYVVKYYSIGDLCRIKLDLFYIWRLCCQIWISGTNKDMNMKNLLHTLPSMTRYHYYWSKLKSHCDWGSVSQSVGLMMRYLLLFDNYSLLIVERPVRQEDGSVFCQSHCVQY
jgi:hypothetical protein